MVGGHTQGGTGVRGNGRDGGRWDNGRWAGAGGGCGRVTATIYIYIYISMVCVSSCKQKLTDLFFPFLQFQGQSTSPALEVRVDHHTLTMKNSLQKKTPTPSGLYRDLQVRMNYHHTLAVKNSLQKKTPTPSQTCLPLFSLSSRLGLPNQKICMIDQKISLTT